MHAAKPRIADRLHRTLAHAARCILPLLWVTHAAQAADARVLKVGDQQFQTRGILEASGQLQDLPYRIEWFNFPAAQPLGEALNAGAVDVGGLGDAPTIFAYAAGARVRIVAATHYEPADLAIIVPDASTIKNATDLKGRRIATTRGSIGHFLLITALARAGLKPTDVQVHFLQPQDAKAALSSGDVDAWASWDPYVALAELRDHDRRIANGVGLSAGLTFELATEAALRDKRAVLDDFLRRMAAAQRWALAHPDQVAAMQSRVTGLPTDVLKVVYQRGQWQPVAIDAAVIAAQQRTADIYTRAGVIPAHLDIAPAFDTATVH
jgi:sulfonate transport system substrate-binding protein